MQHTDDYNTYTPWIVCAAMTDGDVIIPSPRHYDPTARELVFRITGKRKPLSNAVQGFIDQRGKFWTRGEACVIARDNGQIKKKTGPENELFSEDIY